MTAKAALGPVAVFSCFPGAPATDPVPGIHVWRHVDSSAHLERQKRRRRRPAWLRTSDGRMDAVDFPEATREFSALLASFQPDVVVFEEIWLYPYLPLVRAYRKTHPCRVIVDNHNVESEVLRARQDIVGRGSMPRRFGAFVQRRMLARLERDFCRESDQVWACSDRDAAQLTNAYALNARRVHVVPNCVDTAFYADVRTNGIQRPPACEPAVPTILYAGSFGYFPNRQAARRLIERIYPRLRQSLPNIRLLLVGASPTPEMRDAAAANSSIVVTGLVEDVRPYYAAADVVVVPLEHGSGTRLKILEAFAAERPVVSTSKGLEGLEATDGVHAVVAEEDGAFAEAVVRILNDPALYRSLCENGRALVEASYSFATAAERIRRLVKQ